MLYTLKLRRKQRSVRCEQRTRTDVASVWRNENAKSVIQACTCTTTAHTCIHRAYCVRDDRYNILYISSAHTYIIRAVAQHHRSRIHVRMFKCVLGVGASERECRMDDAPWLRVTKLPVRSLASAMCVRARCNCVIALFTIECVCVLCVHVDVCVVLMWRIVDVRYDCVRCMFTHTHTHTDIVDESTSRLCYLQTTH